MMEEPFCRFWNQPYGSQIPVPEFCVEGERLVDMETGKIQFPWEEKNSSLLQSSGHTRMEGI